MPLPETRTTIHTHTQKHIHTRTHTHTHMCRAYLKEGEVNGEIQEKGRVFKFADFLKILKRELNRKHGSEYITLLGVTDL